MASDDMQPQSVAAHQNTTHRAANLKNVGPPTFPYRPVTTMALRRTKPALRK
jgi:hypothetical protein